MKVEFNKFKFSKILIMKDLRSSDIMTVVNVTIAPLQQSEYVLRTQDSLIHAWSSNIPEQFPIESVDEQGEIVVLNIGSPHKNYTIQTEMKRGELHGKAVIKSPTNVVVGKIHYLNGEMTGKCKLYNEEGVLFFKGYLKNGYRQGKGIEYDIDGKVLFDGLFVGGSREYHYHKVLDLEGYWAELEDDGTVKSICQIDDNLYKQGVCLFYDHSEIEQISLWKDNVEIELIKRFNNGIMTEYKNGVKSYKGSYYAIGKTCFARVSGLEYDSTGRNVIYDGDFIDGMRSGFGTLYNSKGDVVYDGVWKYGIRSSVYIGVVYTIFTIVLLALLYFCIFVDFDFAALCGLLIGALILALYIYTKLIKLYTIPVPFDYSENKTIKVSYLPSREVIIHSNMNDFTYFAIDGLRKMRKLNILKMETDLQSSPFQRYVRIYNCEELEEMTIGDGAFLNFNEFSLQNLPSLRKIQIGEINNLSLNFMTSAFILEGNRNAKSLTVDLPHLKSVILGGGSFDLAEEIVFQSRM